jgi:multidrug resistance efflux pump
LKRLPLRPIVAFAACCARRVETISQFPADHPRREARRVAIDNAIRLAVVRVLVHDNYRVQRGALLVQLNREPYQVQVDIKKRPWSTPRPT